MAFLLKHQKFLNTEGSFLSHYDYSLDLENMTGPSFAILQNKLEKR